LQLGITPKKFMVKITARLNGVATTGGSGGFEDIILVAPGVTVSAKVFELALKLLSPL
jgi:hypothetical protein